MLPRNEVAKDTRKRKMKEVAETPLPDLPLPLLPMPPSGPAGLHFPGQTQLIPPYFSTTTLHSVLNNFQNPNVFQQNMLLSTPFNFKSYPSLLMEDDGPDSLTATIKEQNDQIDQIIIAHEEHLKRTLADMQRRHNASLFFLVEERAAKKLQEKEIELHQMLCRNRELEEKEACARTEVQHWKNHVSQLEATGASLQLALQDAIIKGGRIEGEAARQQVPDQESSTVDPDHVEPRSMMCRVCRKRGARVMLWPCRHLCICKNCDDRIKDCPVCQTAKTASVEVYLE